MQLLGLPFRVRNFRIDLTMPLPRHVRKAGNKRMLDLKVQKNKFMSFSTPLKLSQDITALEITHARKAASKHSTALRYASHSLAALSHIFACPSPQKVGFSTRPCNQAFQSICFCEIVGIGGCARPNDRAPCVLCHSPNARQTIHACITGGSNSESVSADTASDLLARIAAEAR